MQILTEDPDGYKSLRNAIIIMAARDYKLAKKKKCEDEVKMLRDFFANDCYGLLIDLDVNGEYILRMIE